MVLLFNTLITKHSFIAEKLDMILLPLFLEHGIMPMKTLGLHCPIIHQFFFLIIGYILKAGKVKMEDKNK